MGGFRRRLLDFRAHTLSEIDTEEEIRALQEQTGAERQDERIGGGASFTFDPPTGLRALWAEQARGGSTPLSRTAAPAPWRARRRW